MTMVLAIAMAMTMAIRDAVVADAGADAVKIAKMKMA